MPNKDGYRDWVLEQLAGAGRITARRMFGGTGLYRDDVFFAIIASDVLYFKVGDANRADYESRGMPQFRPFDDKPHLSMNYYEVPADVLEDPDECAHWAQRSVSVALATRKPRPRAKPKIADNTKATRSAKRRKPSLAAKSKAARGEKPPKSKVTAKSKATKGATRPRAKIARQPETAKRARPKGAAKAKAASKRAKQSARP